MNQDDTALTDPEYWSRHWQGRAMPGEAAHLDWFWRAYSNRHFDSVMKRVLGPANGRSLLDVGCGVGDYTHYFVRGLGFRVTGIDYVPEAVERTRSNLASMEIQADIRQADLFTLEGAWDVVFAGGLIEHFEDPVELLAGLARVTRPGGYVLNWYPNLQGLNLALVRLLVPAMLESHRTVAPRRLREAYRRTGLQEVLTCYNGGPGADLWVGGLRPRLGRWALRGCERLHRLLERFGTRAEAAFWSPYMITIARKPGPTE